MKKISPDSTENTVPADPDTADQSAPSAAAQPPTSARVQTPRLVDPMTCIFEVQPDADAITMLDHASQNLALVKALVRELMTQMEGRDRNTVVVIGKLAMLSEILINRALRNLEARGRTPVFH
ncbi:DUF6124 family protein [Pseudomonas sp. SJZ131]|uniref:DUF6124 family protein n=1 Tax=Pseudomonas sp. SJZ131 TaxID=2572895 RepID=UPI00119A2F43|nr:DUF6124 family protein [Pseudomonas sp. SJZ131]TWD49043.1 hypothetical protein FBY12_1441 [Pseudomonas sp. SJZ131]